MEINPNDLEITTWWDRPANSGGFDQKADNACKIEHKPTGLEATVRGERSIHRARAAAMEELKSKVAAAYSIVPPPPVLPAGTVGLSMSDWKQTDVDAAAPSSFAVPRWRPPGVPAQTSAANVGSTEDAKHWEACARLRLEELNALKLACDALHNRRNQQDVLINELKANYEGLLKIRNDQNNLIDEFKQLREHDKSQLAFESKLNKQLSAEIARLEDIVHDIVPYVPHGQDEAIEAAFNAKPITRRDIALRHLKEAHISMGKTPVPSNFKYVQSYYDAVNAFIKEFE